MTTRRIGARGRGRTGVPAHRRTGVQTHGRTGVPAYRRTVWIGVGVALSVTVLAAGGCRSSSEPPVDVPAAVPVQTLEKVVGADRDTLRALNFSLLDPVWVGRRPVPRGFDLHVPAGVDAERT